VITSQSTRLYFFWRNTRASAFSPCSTASRKIDLHFRIVTTRAPNGTLGRLRIPGRMASMARPSVNDAMDLLCKRARAWKTAGARCCGHERLDSIWPNVRNRSATASFPDAVSICTSKSSRRSRGLPCWPYPGIRSFLAVPLGPDRHYQMKINFLEPSSTEIRADARVLRQGRVQSVVDCEVIDGPALVSRRS